MSKVWVDLLVDPRDHLEQVAARLLHVVELASQEVVPLLQRLELAAREQVHTTDQRHPALHELRPPLDRVDGVRGLERGQRLLRVRVVAFAQQPLGLADPSVQIAAESVLVLVFLAQTLQLACRLAPRLVRRGLGLGRRALGLSRLVASDGGELCTSLGIADTLLGARARALGIGQRRPQRGRVE